MTPMQEQLWKDTGGPIHEYAEKWLANFLAALWLGTSIAGMIDWCVR